MSAKLKEAELLSILFLGCEQLGREEAGYLSKKEYINLIHIRLKRQRLSYKDIAEILPRFPLNFLSYNEISKLADSLNKRERKKARNKERGKREGKKGEEINNG